MKFHRVCGWNGVTHSFLLRSRRGVQFVGDISIPHHAGPVFSVILIATKPAFLATNGAGSFRMLKVFTDAPLAAHSLWPWSK
jgi:hypothetical protein